MRVPVVLVTGVDPDAMAAATVGLQWDLPTAVAVRHHIDVDRQVLERVVSDATGVLEREEIELEHACISCALREDVVPTLERLVESGRWESVVAHLPIGAEAVQVCNVLAWNTRLARHLRVASVVCAMVGSTVVEDLLGDDLLRERDRHSSEEDARGVGEVAAAMIEYADVVVLSGSTDPVGVDLTQTLARPGARVVEGTEHLTGSLVTGQLHDHTLTSAWTAAVRPEELPPAVSSRVWTVDLRSAAAFHPDRLLDDLERLGAGRHRSRGCFWLPTRPGDTLVWDGAGGQLSIGRGEPWGRRTPFTRIVLTGVGLPPAHLDDSFESMLLRPAEHRASDTGWLASEDGFEPWLGPIRDVA
ncbi:GTP-binding protein [Nocardioides sp.]|uniref:CobW family GTP-binding protein n=1 Tax=Nocardioides sp. TaxID=35761 RepID=UPI0027369BA3|nr:GTP-binding protein [Nocardioides sp.]MDP3891168.1 GTP-binding protein [Nocardioides sp.]